MAKKLVTILAKYNTNTICWKNAAQHKYDISRKQMQIDGYELNHMM